MSDAQNANPRLIQPFSWPPLKPSEWSQAEWEAKYREWQVADALCIRWAQNRRGEWIKVEWGNPALKPADGGPLPVFQLMYDKGRDVWPWIGLGTNPPDWQSGPERVETVTVTGPDGNPTTLLRPCGTPPPGSRTQAPDPSPPISLSNKASPPAPQKLPKGLAIATGFGFLATLILPGYAGSCALLLAVPGLGLSLGCLLDTEFRGAVDQTMKNQLRDKEIDPFITYTFARSPEGYILPSKETRQRMDYIRLGSGFFAPAIIGLLLFLSMIFKLGTVDRYGQFDSAAMFSALGFLLGWFVVSLVTFGMMLRGFSETIKRQPTWEGPERKERVSIKGEWQWVSRGLPSGMRIVHRDAPEPNEPAEAKFTRIFNPQTGAYEYVQGLSGNPNVKPAVSPLAPDGGHGDARFRGAGDLEAGGFVPRR